MGPGIGLQGLVLFGLYIAGIVGALLAALVLRKTAVKRRRRGVHDGAAQISAAARLADIAIGLWQRAMIFLKRAGTIILVTTIILWALASFPAGRSGPEAVRRVDRRAHRRRHPCRRRADRLQQGHQHGAASGDGGARGGGRRRSARSIRSTPSDEQGLQTLEQRLSGRWSLPTALAFLAWFVFAPQCISTIAVTRRETNGWKWPLFMVTYLFVLAYLAAGATYWMAVAFGLG